MNNDNDKLAKYGNMLTNYVMYDNEGNFFTLAKIAKELNRDIYSDIIEMKQWFIETK